MNIPIFNTFVHPDANKQVAKVLDSTFLSEGKLVKEFEDLLSKEMQIKNPMLVNSGTASLHLALILAGVGENDEVILPAQTFVASGLAILYQKAKPIFADIDYNTGNISVESIRKNITKKTKAIMVVHWGGYPCEMDEIQKIANEFNLPIIEDAAHAFGAVYKNQVIGQISDFTCFSFQAIKHLTTGDGGALACKDEKKAKESLVRRWFGIDRENAMPSILGERQFDLTLLGYKYHMNDYSAALGIANFSGFKERLLNRINIANLYFKNLDQIDGIKLFKYKNDRQSAYWLFGFHVERRDDFINSMKSRGITASVVHQRIDKYSIFGGMKNNLIEQRRFDESQIHIPIHDDVTIEKANYIINQIKKGW
jgi:perosamine synthetase